MTVTDEMVEAGARLIAQEHGSTAFDDDHVPYEFTDAERDQYRAEARAVAEFVAPLIAAQALRSAAEEIRRELVCCDVYETLGPVLQARNLEGANEEVSDKNTGGHQICYWGDAAARIVEPLTADVEPDRCCARPNMVWEHSRAGKDHFRCVACGGGMTKARAT